MTNRTTKSVIGFKRPGASGVREVLARKNNHSLNMVEAKQEAAAKIEEVKGEELVNEKPNKDLESLDFLVDDVNHIEELNAINNTDLPLYDLVCNGVICETLLDSRASGCYVSPRIARGLSIKLITKRQVETARGHRINITEGVTLLLNASGFVHDIMAYILDTKFDLILGRDWIKH
ncbi:hypothetical protein EC973_006603 [Apophysomyces ossiformis]|uniref:Uncharacterized protein n=1 Tax=Apophysomyces ossiformis TaxID=679940 RepID=A0A8H7BEL1_9FUNG|nr:hypothetical protein EC973_006603 [Apophysomyces ossiformis]